MNSKYILKACIAYQKLTDKLHSIASVDDISYEVKMASELTKEELQKLDNLTLHSKSMMSSFIQNVYFERLDVPAIVSIVNKNAECIGWSVMQFTKIKDNYVKSIDVFVKPEYRKSGIGSKLVNLVKERGSLIHEINGVPVEEIPRVGAWDEASRKFFQKHELKGDIEDPAPPPSEKIEPVTELDKMFAELDEEILQSASSRFKKMLLKFSI